MDRCEPGPHLRPGVAGAAVHARGGLRPHTARSPAEESTQRRVNPVAPFASACPLQNGGVDSAPDETKGKVSHVNPSNRI